MRTRTHRRVNRSMQVLLSGRRHTHMHGLPLGSLDRFWATIFGPPCAPNCPKFGAFGHRFLCIAVGARGFKTVCLFCSALAAFVRSTSSHPQSTQMKERGQAVQHCKLKLNSVGSGRTALDMFPDSNLSQKHVVEQAVQHCLTWSSVCGPCGTLATVQSL